mgnify:CR=1 FL=1
MSKRQKRSGAKRTEQQIRQRHLNSAPRSGDKKCRTQYGFESDADVSDLANIYRGELFCLIGVGCHPLHVALDNCLHLAFHLFFLRELSLKIIAQKRVGYVVVDFSNVFTI